MPIVKRGLEVRSSKNWNAGSEKNPKRDPGKSQLDPNIYNYFSPLKVIEYYNLNTKKATRKGIVITVIMVVTIIAASFLVYFIP